MLKWCSMRACAVVLFSVLGHDTVMAHGNYHLTNDTYGLGNATDGYLLDNVTQPNITGMCAGNTDPAEDVACPAGFAAKRNATGEHRPVRCPSRQCLFSLLCHLSPAACSP